MVAPHSRRELLVGAGAAALGSAGLLSGCGSSTKTPSDVLVLGEHSPGAKQDIRVLNQLLDLEYHAIYAYTASVPLLAAIEREQASSHKKSSSAAKKPAAKKKTAAPLTTVALLASNAASQFLSQEISHTLEWKAIIKQAGGKAARPAGSYEVGSSSSKRDILLALHGIERAQLVAYLEAVTLLAPGRLRAGAAAIFSNHAQQLMVLRMQLGLPPIPSAFVTGQE